MMAPNDPAGTPPQDGAGATVGAVPSLGSAAYQPPRRPSGALVDDGPPAGSERVPRDEVVPRWLIWTYTATLAALTIGVAALLLAIWPLGSTRPAQEIRFLWFTVRDTMSPDVRLMLVAMLTGVIGAMVHVMTSLADFAGNARLSRNWLPWYLLRPFIGMALALFFYIVVRAGFIGAQGDASQVNAYGIAAIAGLAGMFSKQATDKLNETFTNMFRTSAKVGDAQRSDKLARTDPRRPNPMPDHGEEEPTA